MPRTRQGGTVSWLQMLRSQVTEDRFDRRLGEIVCYAAALAVIVLGLAGLERFGLSGGLLLLGILAILNLAVLLIAVGLLTRLGERSHLPFPRRGSGKSPRPLRARKQET